MYHSTRPPQNRKQKKDNKKMIETTIKGDKKRRKFDRDENPPKRIETKQTYVLYRS